MRGAVEGDLALLAADEAEQRLAEGGLAGAQLADDAEGLGAVDGDVEVVDGDERHVDRLEEGALLQRVDDLDALALEHRRAGDAFERAGDALGLGGEEAPGVGVARAGEELAGRAVLDDAAVLHHVDVVGELLDDRQVVGDQHHRHAVAGLQLAQER